MANDFAFDVGGLWLEYCAKQLGHLPHPSDVEVISFEQALELLFEWQPPFTKRFNEIRSTPYSTAFDREADEALLLICLNNNFDCIDAISAGAWRVLDERLLYLKICITLEDAAGTDYQYRLPAGLCFHDKAIAVGLKLLGNEGRTIDRTVLPLERDGSLPAFPWGLSLRKQ